MGLGCKGSEPYGPLAEAFAAFYRFVPEELDGSAEEDGAEDCPAGPDEDESHQTVIEDAEEAVREDAQVLQQDREFAEKQSEVVDDNGSPEGFQRCYRLEWGEGVKVATHAVFHCWYGISMSRVEWLRMVLRPYLGSVAQS